MEAEGVFTIKISNEERKIMAVALSQYWQQIQSFDRPNADIAKDLSNKLYALGT